MDREPQKEIIFTGKIDKSKRTWLYDVMVRGLSQPCRYAYCHSIALPDGCLNEEEAILCAGVAKYLLGKSSNYNEVMAWGYIGLGPQLLSAMLLVAAHDTLDPSLKYYAAYSLREHGQLMTLAQEHYMAFTKEIVSKLPDSWTLSATEILAWIDKQKQTTTPEVKHERETETK